MWPVTGKKQQQFEDGHTCWSGWTLLFFLFLCLLFFRFVPVPLLSLVQGWTHSPFFRAFWRKKQPNIKSNIHHWVAGTTRVRTCFCSLSPTGMPTHLHQSHYILSAFPSISPSSYHSRAEWFPLDLAPMGICWRSYWSPCGQWHQLYIFSRDAG